MKSEMDSEFEESLHELLGQTPSAWVEQAECLRISAKLHWTKLMELETLSPTLPGVRVQTLACIDSYMLLTGLSFEVLIKGVHISKTPNLSVEQRFNEWDKYRGGHGISTLIDLVDSISLEEKEMLKRLEEFTQWAGRYPIPKRVHTYCNSKEKHLLSVNTRDPILCDALFKRLSAMIKTTNQ